MSETKTTGKTWRSETGIPTLAVLLPVIIILILSNFTFAQPTTPSDPNNWETYEDSSQVISSYSIEGHKNIGGWAFKTISGPLNMIQCEDAWAEDTAPKAAKAKGEFDAGKYASMLSYAIYAAGIIFLAIAVLYLVGQALQSPQLLSIAREEWWQTLMTIFLAVFIIGIMVTMNIWFTIKISPGSELAEDAIYKQTTSIIDAAMIYTQYMTYQIASNLSSLLLFNMWLHTLYSATIYVGITFKAMFSFNVGPVLKPIVDIVGIVIQFLSATLVEWVAHFYILCFTKRWVFAIFVPAAMLLRAFPQTRSAGTALFALVFSFVIVYPVMMIMNWEAYKLTSPVVLPSDTLLENFFTSTGLFGAGITAIILGMLVGSIAVPILIGGVISLVFDIVKSAVYYIVIVSIILPFINIFVTLTAAKEIARFFGSEVSFTSFVKLI
ncbi:TPA: hypothetical protein HA238_00785 [Candidatus Micrarchaeota archaeon]|nr:hypothetical protein [Candidatus Micrarchaeota archaeon]